jgi:hypothetical protein
MTKRNSKLLDLLNTDITKLFASRPVASTKESAGDSKQWIPRQSKRQNPPYGATNLDVHLLTSSGEEIAVAVWNLSESGACVKSSTNLRAHLNARVTLRAHNETCTKTIEVEAVVRWVDSVAPNLYFVGLKFNCDPSVIRGSFLSAHIS